MSDEEREQIVREHQDPLAASRGIGYALLFSLIIVLIVGNVVNQVIKVIV